MDTVRQQLTFAVRSLIARASSSLIVIATLALGIGANTAIFSILHALWPSCSSANIAASRSAGPRDGVARLRSSSGWAPRADDSSGSS